MRAGRVLVFHSLLSRNMKEALYDPISASRNLLIAFKSTTTSGREENRGWLHFWKYIYIDTVFAAPSVTPEGKASATILWGSFWQLCHRGLLRNMGNSIIFFPLENPLPSRFLRKSYNCPEECFFPPVIIEALYSQEGYWQLHVSQKGIFKLMTDWSAPFEGHFASYDKGVSVFPAFVMSCFQDIMWRTILLLK